MSSDYLYNPQLKICFFLKVGYRFYGEGLIFTNLQEIRKAVKSREIYLPAPDGAVSLLYNGEELLGIEFWDAINLINPIPNALLTGEEQTIFLPMQTFGVKLRGQGNELFYHAISSHASRPWNVKRSLPLDLFIKEWTLMHLRYHRLCSSLGRRSSDTALSGYRGKQFMSQEWRRMVGPESLEYVLNEDLETLLSESGCQRGYVYTDESGFVPM